MQRSRRGGLLRRPAATGSDRYTNRFASFPSARVSIRLPGELSRYVVERGSIAVDGVSLTIAAVDDEEITVALIPHTLAVTTLGLAAPGRRLNVEADVIARYVERSMERSG